MDPGQIGVVIKVMNLLTGGVVAGWAGLVMMLNIASFVACDEDTSIMRTSSTGRMRRRGTSKNVEGSEPGLASYE